MVILAALPGMVRELLVTGNLVKPGNLSVSVNFLGYRIRKVGLVIEHLQADGSYASVESSRFLPIRAEDVRRWLVVEDSTRRLAWERRLGEWARGLGGRA